MKEQKLLTIRILTPEMTLFEGDALAVFLPGVMGSFEILPGHAPIISMLEAGSIRIRTAESKEESVSIRTGVAKLRDNVLTICAEQ